MIHAPFLAWRSSLALALLALTTACGGGGGSAPQAADPVAADAATPAPSAAACTPAGVLTQAPRPVASSSIAVEPKSGGRVWVVNQDNDSVSVIDPASRSLIREIPVGAAPRTVAIGNDGLVWVTSRDAATLSLIDPTSLAVTGTVRLPAATQPFGIVIAPTDGSAWVTLQATGELVRVDATCKILTDRIAVGADARHLSMPATGDRVLVSRFISPPLPDESTTQPKTSVGGAPRGGEVVLVDATTRAVSGTVVLAVSQKSDTSLQGRGIPNYLGAAAIAPDGQSAWLPSKQDNVLRGLMRDSNPLDFQNTVRAISSRLVLGTAPAEDLVLRVDHDNSGVASAAVFDPTGQYVFVALETSRQVALLDPVGGREVVRFEAGLAPQGLAISADGKLLAVSNLMSRTVGLYDLSDLTGFVAPVIRPIAAVATVTTEKLAPTLLAGKRLFYDARDPRLARDGYLSCASCHNDGGGDGRVWDLSGFGEGLRNTIPLQGRAAGQLPLHWSGNFDEVQDFEGQIRNFAQGLGLMSDAAYLTGTRALPLGDAKAGLSADLDALAAYVGSLGNHQPSPYRNPDRSLTAPAVAGKALFAGLGCTRCHDGAAFAGDGSVRHDVGTLKAASGQRLGSGVPLDGIDSPTLRDVWATGPYLHDGSAATIADAIRAHTRIPSIVAASDDQISRVADYVRQIGSEE